LVQIPHHQPFDVLLQGWKDPRFVFTSSEFAAASSQTKLAVLASLTAQRALAQVVFVSRAGQRYDLLQVRAEDLNSTERTQAMVLGQAIRAGMWSRRYSLRRIIG
jgi:hypothetical protein